MCAERCSDIQMKREGGDGLSFNELCRRKPVILLETLGCTGKNL